MRDEEKFQKYSKLSKSFQFKFNYCGCCGNETDNDLSNWCSKCESHVDRKGMKAPWNRTYFALTGKDCPFQIKTNE